MTLRERIADEFSDLDNLEVIIDKDTQMHGVEASKYTLLFDDPVRPGRLKLQWEFADSLKADSDTLIALMGIQARNDLEEYKRTGAFENG